MRKILVNIFANSVKVFELTGKDRRLILEKDIPFQENYCPERGLNFNDEEALIRLLERMSVNFLDCKIEVKVDDFFLDIEKRHLEELFSEIKKRARVDLKLSDSFI